MLKWKDVQEVSRSPLGSEFEGEDNSKGIWMCPMRDRKQKNRLKEFVESSGGSYGYGGTIDTIRDEEFRRLQGS